MKQDNVEYIKLLLAKFDGQDVAEQLLEYKDEKPPHWYKELQSTDAVFKFSSSLVPDKHVIVSTTFAMRGLRLGERRPNKVECLWVGNDFDFNNKRIEYVLYDEIPHAMTLGVGVDAVKLVHPHWFVKQIGKANGKA